MDFFKRSSAPRQQKLRFLKQNSESSDENETDCELEERVVELEKPSCSTGLKNENNKHVEERENFGSDLSSVNNSEKYSSLESLNTPQTSRDECLIDNENRVIGMREKITDWTINNISNVKLTAVSQLLKLLKTEGYSELPSSAATLLGFTHAVKTRPLISKRNTIGDYVYLGIQNGLENLIKTDVYQETQINVQVHIDGMTVYTNSKGQLWPIALKVRHKDYECSPFVIALYYGTSKPKDVQEYMEDFVEEAKNLTANGVRINGKLYQFKIQAIIGDGPARTFVKCTKGPNGFSACERCEVVGCTVNRKRVYPEVNCKKRTKESFITRTDIEHQPTDCESPLLKIPVDPIKDVPQEIMHLLFLNLAKALMKNWLIKKNPHKLKAEKVEIFRTLMDNISQFVPCEFQRKDFEIDYFSQWKATQLSFLVLYAGPVILKYVLSKDLYDHFLLLNAGCRIMCSAELAVPCHEIGHDFLQKFFILMPSFYGVDCQVMHAHGLLHLSEDVEYFQVPLTELSAFWGENFIGKIINNRVTAMNKKEENKIKKKKILSNCILEEPLNVCIRNGVSMINFESINYKEVKIEAKRPNNLVHLHDNRFLLIEKILINKKADLNIVTAEEILIEGYCDSGSENFFDKPCPSSEIGIFSLKGFETYLQCFNLNAVKEKCLLLKVNGNYSAISLLHC